MTTKLLAFALIAAWWAGSTLVSSQELPTEAKSVHKLSRVATLAWTICPTKKIEQRNPPEGWKLFSDVERGVSWSSPSDVKKTVKTGGPPTVVYDAQDGNIRISFYCFQTDTRFLGSPTLLLDSMDEAMLGSLKRHGINGTPKPIANVKYGDAIGRILRIDVAGSKTMLKCDLTMPTECYTFTVVGLPGDKLNGTLGKCVTSLRFTPANDK